MHLLPASPRAGRPAGLRGDLPGGARVFGDLDDPDSEVAKLVAEKCPEARLEEHGTRPKVLYVHLKEHLGWE